MTNLYIIAGGGLIAVGLVIWGFDGVLRWLDRNEDMAFGEGPDQYADAWLDEEQV